MANPVQIGSTSQQQLSGFQLAASARVPEGIRDFV
jgi:hypothetical protein